jgi:putative hydrolase of the HAD superfamily
MHFGHPRWDRGHYHTTAEPVEALNHVPMNQLPPAVLLDLDDTILDDSGTVSSCWLEACVAHRSEMNGLDPLRVYEAIERTREWYWSDPGRHRVGRLDLGAARRDVVRLALAEIGVDDPDLAEKVGDRYHALRDAGLQPFTDAIATVQWLRETGCRLALLTNGSADAQRSKINRFNLADLFDVILIEGELGFGKPDPRVYVRALDAVGVAACDAWMVGDNLEWDVAQPQRQGIAGIWVDVRGKGLPSGHAVRPNRIIRRLSDLREPGAGQAD